MSAISKWTIGLALFAGAAYAQVPSTNDTSDDHDNTGVGTGALGGPAASAGGDFNTAVGYAALLVNATGNANTAVGYGALGPNNTGSDNTASGYYALGNNATANYNTAVGYEALDANDYSGAGTATNNTASGYKALFSNVNAADNTAVGYEALYTNDPEGTGIAIDNTAIGVQALYTNATGAANTAAGGLALNANLSGGYNAAAGFQALYMNSSGSYNTACGPSALFSSNGNNNTAVGYEAGYNLKTGGNNIEIGNKGATGDDKVIKIGTEGTQTKTLIAGIYRNTAVSGLAVVIGSNGELGAVSSSERFKTAIAPMGAHTEKLRQLRPVTFRYKGDQQGTLRYGLIAEEVADVFPELVVRDGRGRIDGVRYDELAPMLLNEMQNEQAAIAAQSQKIASLEQQLAGIQAALNKPQPKDELVARR
jgi:hypothetical protein